MPFTKHSYLIKDGLDIPRVVNEAFHIANTGRPGPVLIDFPMDLLKKNLIIRTKMRTLISVATS